MRESDLQTNAPLPAAEASSGAGVQDPAYEAWAAKVRGAFPALDIIRRSTEPAPRQLTAGRCGVVKTVRISGAGQLFDRSKAHIERSPSEHPFFCWQRAEPLRIAHGRGTDELQTGGFVLHESNRPHSIHMERPFDLICAQMPDTIVRERSGVSISRWSGSLLRFSPSIHRIVGAAMTALTDEHETPSDAVAVGDLFMEVVGRGLSEQDRVERSATPTASRRAEALRRFVEAHCRNEHLAPADAAAELGCSLRLVHATAASLGTTFGRMVLEARLQAALAALQGGHAERIGEVAYASGFADLSYFARAFKTRFGVPPSRIAGR